MNAKERLMEIICEHIQTGECLARCDGDKCLQVKDFIKEIQLETINEFAERLKDVFVTIDGTFECWEIEEHIDELVREKTEQEGE